MALIKWKFFWFVWMRCSMGMAISTDCMEVRRKTLRSGKVLLQSRRVTFSPFIGRLWIRQQAQEWS